MDFGHGLLAEVHHVAPPLAADTGTTTGSAKTPSGEGHPLQQAPGKLC